MDAIHATSLNFHLDAPHTGHSSGAWPKTVWPQSLQTYMGPAAKSFPASKVSSALL